MLIFWRQIIHSNILPRVMPHFAYHWKFLIVSEQKCLLLYVSHLYVCCCPKCTLSFQSSNMTWLNIWMSDHWCLNASNPVVINLNVITWKTVLEKLCLFLLWLFVYLSLSLLPLGYLHKYPWRVGIFPVLTFYLFACFFWKRKKADVSGNNRRLAKKIELN